MTTDYQDEQLSALLASLPQPSPSAELDAAILGYAETALATPVAVIPAAVAANDSADGAVRTLPAKKTTDYLTRWRIPLGLAAAVLLTFNLVGGDFFGHKKAQFPVMGEPHDTGAVAPAAPAAESAADMAPQPAPPVQAEAMHAPALPRAAMTAPAVSKQAPMPAPPKLDASVWLVKIDGLLKAGLAPAARQEWAEFRKAYPDYPVEQQLQKRLEP